MSGANQTISKSTLYITGLQNRNESLFYRVLIDNMEELTPIIYIPTVGQACLEYSRIFSESRGIFITKYDRGCVKKILKNWRIKMLALLWSPTVNESWGWAISVLTA
jgi:malate dehydrogenase (oxaloacetate-decarboxylating)(NADP+)